jgi:hypothetical protein
MRRRAASLFLAGMVLFRPEKQRAPARSKQKSIAASAAPTKKQQCLGAASAAPTSFGSFLETCCDVGGPEGPILLAGLEEEHRGFRRSHNSSRSYKFREFPGDLL